MFGVQAQRGNHFLTLFCPRETRVPVLTCYRGTGEGGELQSGRSAPKVTCQGAVWTPGRLRFWGRFSSVCEVEGCHSR